ncbi:MAG: hypothetical protein EA350_10195 [Gemmatimonadales bacterium]|nr:MAG: hypothetical protein EA350_10195 [Gemmatimonadales bacterium]
MKKVAVSVLVPVTERPEPLAELYAEFSAPLRDAGLTFEFLFIAEPHYLDRLAPLERLQAEGEPIRILRMGLAGGDTALLRVGAERASHDVLLTLPAYYRIEADALLAVLRPVVEDNAAMSIARRWPRRDSVLNRLQNRVFHGLVSAVGGGRQIHDVACGVRAIRRDAFEVLPMYGDFHRFLPLLALRAGFEVVEVDAAQHRGDWQPRIYAPGIYVRRVLDVFGLLFLMRFTEKPLRFFGLLGTGSFLAGAIILVVLAVQRIQGQALADRPMLLLGALLVVMGIQAFAIGLVGEIIVHVNAPTGREKRVREIFPPGGTPPIEPSSPEADLTSPTVPTSSA